MNFPTFSRPAILAVATLLLSIAGCSFNTPFPQKTTASHSANSAKFPATIPQPAVNPAPVKARIEVLKSSRTLRLWQGETLVFSLGVALGQQPQGRKTCQGDSRTPEGVYTVTERKADSQFHLALRLSYPNAADRLRASESGCEPGGDIMIHGLPNGRGYVGAAHRLEDWTEGCVAVTNEEMDRLWALVPVGTRVEIRP